MDVDFNFSDKNVAIIGLGLMGGSLAIGLKGRCLNLFGVDTDPDTQKLALEKTVVDQVYTNITEIEADIDLLILATPVCSILTILNKLPGLLTGSPIVLGVGHILLLLVDQRVDPSFFCKFRAF